MRWVTQEDTAESIRKQAGIHPIHWRLSTTQTVAIPAQRSHRRVREAMLGLQVLLLKEDSGAHKENRTEEKAGPEGHPFYGLTENDGGRQGSDSAEFRQHGIQSVEDGRHEGAMQEFAEGRTCSQDWIEDEQPEIGHDHGEHRSAGKQSQQQDHGIEGQEADHQGQSGEKEIRSPISQSQSENEPKASDERDGIDRDHQKGTEEFSDEQLAA